MCGLCTIRHDDVESEQHPAQSRRGESAIAVASMFECDNDVFPRFADFAPDELVGVPLVIRDFLRAGLVVPETRAVACLAVEHILDEVRERDVALLAAVVSHQLVDSLLFEPQPAVQFQALLELLHIDLPRPVAVEVLECPAQLSRATSQPAAHFLSDEFLRFG